MQQNCLIEALGERIRQLVDQNIKVEIYNHKHPTIVVTRYETSYIISTFISFNDDIMSISHLTVKYPTPNSDKEFCIAEPGFDIMKTIMYEVNWVTWRGPTE